MKLAVVKMLGIGLHQEINQAKSSGLALLRPPCSVDSLEGGIAG